VLFLSHGEKQSAATAPWVTIATSKSQHVTEQRNCHVFAAGLMVSEGTMKKLDDLEKCMLLHFFMLVEADEDSMALMKAMMRKAYMKGSSVLRKYMQVKAFLIN